MLNEKVFVLKRTKYGEADLIVHCLTSEGAKLKLFARSALKSKKRFGGGVLEPSNYIQISYRTAKNSNPDALGTLQEAKLLNSFEGIRQNLDRLNLAYFLLAVVEKVSQEDDVHARDLFNLLGNCFKALETSEHVQKLRLQFELKLLAYQGVLPQIADADGFLKHSVADHDKIDVKEESLGKLRGQVHRVFCDHLGLHNLAQMNL